VAERPAQYRAGGQQKGATSRAGIDKRLDAPWLLANPEAERALLGSVLLDPQAIHLVRRIVIPSDFQGVDNRAIYAAMCHLSEDGEPLDLLTVSDHLAGQGKDKPADLVSLLTAMPTSVHVEGYARIVADLGIRRQLLAYHTAGAARVVDEDTTPQELQSRDLAELQRVMARTNTDMLGVEQVASELADYIASRVDHPGISGLPTGLADLDDSLDGLGRGKLIILAGRPGHGKTALALQIAEHVATQGNHVAIFTLEVTAYKCLQRMACRRAQVNQRDVNRGSITGEEHTRLLQATAELSELPIEFCAMASPTVADIVAQVTRLKATRDLGLVVVDYIQLMQMPYAENKNNSVGIITRSLKVLANEQRVAMLACSQLNREADKRDSGLGRLADLRDSGAIEQDADQVAFVFYPRQHAKDMGKPCDLPDTALVAKKKDRDGETGHIWLRFDAPTQIYQDLAREYWPAA